MGLMIRKLQNEEERFEAERLLAISFLHTWNEEEARKNAREPEGDVWAAFDASGRMVSAISTMTHQVMYEGNVITCGEPHMVGTLPEARGLGAVRAIMEQILREYKSRGDLFAKLIPFSFAFYRKYGFELASEFLKQKAAIDQFAGFRQEFAAAQILSQQQADEARLLYENYIRRYNMADMRSDADWALGRYGEFGQRDWQYEDRQRYSYLFTDQDANARAYFTFIFIHGPQGPFTGEMKVTDLAFDSPEALRSIFGFIYGMRAKITHVSVDTPRDLDLSLILPECDSVERKLDGYITARALNIEGILTAMKQPHESGTYSVRVTDGFLSENTGTYTVVIENGIVKSVSKDDKTADLEVTVETFCQMSTGLIDLSAALYRLGTKLVSNRDLLERVFVRKPILLL